MSLAHVTPPHAPWLRELRAPRGPDRTGETVGVWTLTAKLTTTGHNNRYRCTCTAGHERIIYTSDLRPARVPPCRQCTPLRRTATRMRSTCTVCHVTGHTAKGCPKRERRAAEPRCRECEGLTHRREAPYCAGCGEPYQPEPPVSLADVMAMPVESRRSEP